VRRQKDKTAFKETQNFLIQESGSMALETAFIFPIILVMIFTIIDMGRLLVADSILQSVSGTLSTELRFLKQVDRANVSLEDVTNQLKQLVTERAGGWISTDDLSLAIIKEEMNNGSPQLGNIGERVTFRASYEFRPATPTFYLLLGSSVLSRDFAIALKNSATGT